MQQAPLRTGRRGDTGMAITRVGLGAWAIGGGGILLAECGGNDQAVATAIGGGGWEFGWGPQQDDESIAALHRALDLGVNWIDPAVATQVMTQSVIGSPTLRARARSFSTFPGGRGSMWS